MSLNKEQTYIKKIMQLNRYPMNVINKTIKQTLKSETLARKNQLKHLR